MFSQAFSQRLASVLEQNAARVENDSTNQLAGVVASPAAEQPDDLERVGRRNH
jgi:hypothetical protein